MPSKKDKAEPWWFTPTKWDGIAEDKVYRQLNYLLVKRILQALLKVQYPTRPRRAKNNWTESIVVDGSRFVLSCRIDENNHKIVVMNIRPLKKISKNPRHK